jgi:hypothetical protein
MNGTMSIQQLLALVQPHVGERLLPSSFAQAIEAITDERQLLTADSDPGHPLWWFLPPVSVALFGDDNAFELLAKDSCPASSVVFVPPPFVSQTHRISRDLSATGLSVVSTAHGRFLPTLAGLLYGGYPWFEVYFRVCSDLGVFGERFAAIFVTHADGDAVRALRMFKDDRRSRYGKPLVRHYEDLGANGIIRDFHTPAHMENIRHVRAIREAAECHESV